MEQNSGESKLRRLAYIKGLFQIGANHLNTATEPSIALATLVFDNCLEMILWLLVDIHGIKISLKNMEVSTPQLLQLVAEHMEIGKLSNTLSVNSGDIQELHRARNGVQHHGIIPSIHSVQRYKATTESVLIRLAKESMDLVWGDVSIALLITEPMARNLYSKAEQEYENANFKEAALCLVAAFELIKEKEQMRRSGSGILAKRFGIANTYEKCDKHFQSIIEYTLTIESEVEILKLGIDYKSYQRYRDFIDIKPFDSVSLSGSLDEILLQIKEVYKEKARSINSDVEIKGWLRFAFAFVLDCILRWQLIERPGLFDI